MEQLGRELWSCEGAGVKDPEPTSLSGLLLYSALVVCVCDWMYIYVLAGVPGSKQGKVVPTAQALRCERLHLWWRCAGGDEGQAVSMDLDELVNDIKQERLSGLVSTASHMSFSFNTSVAPGTPPTAACLACVAEHMEASSCSPVDGQPRPGWLPLQCPQPPAAWLELPLQAASMPRPVLPGQLLFAQHARLCAPRLGLCACSCAWRRRLV